MTARSKKEYLEALRPRYLRAGKAERGRILDEAVAVTQYHRKAVIRVLRSAPQSPPKKRPGRRRRYGLELVPVLKDLWEIAARICPQRLQPFLPELMEVMWKQGDQRLTASVQGELRAMSASTIDRLLKPLRDKEGRRTFTTTTPGSLLKGSIPVRTFSDWSDRRPGFLEIDLVAHCGESTQGFYLCTLTAVDIATGWTECEPVWGKGQLYVRSALHRLLRRLPFPVLGLDSDNGSEFINHALIAYCRARQITFTRSRPYQKNDSAHVEQKNGQVVRRLVGYDRYSSRKALEGLGLLYAAVRPYGNFFQPVMQLQRKTRNGAKVHKVYDRAATPYRRLLASPHATEKQRAALSATYRGINPKQLLGYIHGHQDRLWKLAVQPPRGGLR